MMPREDTISPAQLRYLHAHYRGLDREQRLERISLIVSRRVGSSLDLTSNEASQVIDRIEQESQVEVW